jgi:membrane peptidoglycan carboxypeptidase
VNEQATMLSTIDDNGLYHSAHIIQSYQTPDGPVTPGVMTQHVVLTPALDSQVQYAMEATTVDGTGTAASLGPNRPIIGKTGTTTNSKSAFFIGAIPQWSFVVGIFTQSQDPNSPQTLTALGGGGFGGTWPAAIWHTFMSQEFGNLPIEQFQKPVFTGAKWNQVGNLPTKKKQPPKKQPSQQPKGGHTPPPTQPPGHGHGHHGGGPSPNPSPSPTFTLPTGIPTSTGSATPTATSTATSTATATSGGKKTPGGGVPGG